MSRGKRYDDTLQDVLALWACPGLPVITTVLKAGYLGDSGMGGIPNQ